jgi:putative chitinase
MRAMRIAWNKTHIQVAHLLGQASHESANFTRLVENTNYSAQGMANTWPTRFAINSKAKIKEPNALALSLHRNSEAIANNVYANRMGNGSVESGDGSLHRGYGVIQLTGKDNQRKFSEYVKDPNIIKYPILIASKYALESALFFFDRNNLWRFATDISTDSIDKVSDGVNRGNPYASGYAIGFDERKSETLHFASIKKYNKSIITESAELICCYDSSNVYIWQEGKWVNPVYQTYGTSFRILENRLLGLEVIFV